MAMCMSMRRGGDDDHCAAYGLAYMTIVCLVSLKNRSFLLACCSEVLLHGALSVYAHMCANESAAG